MKTENEYMESGIAKQIAEIEGRIKDLQSEKSALERLLLRTRRQSVDARDLPRKNSVNRVLIERRLFDALRRSQKPLSNGDLYFEARSAVVNLNENTFRSHIKRLKDTEKIIPVGKKWKLPET